MKICYIYFNRICYKDVKVLLQPFEETLIDLQTQTITNEYDIYLIDIQEYTKDIALLLRKYKPIFTNALVFMFNATTNSANFYQLAYLFQAKSIISYNQAATNIIQTIKSSYNLHLLEIKSQYVGKFVSQHLSYMIFKEKKLIYVSETLLKRFSLNTLQDVEEKIVAKLPLTKLLSHQDCVYEINKIFDEEHIDIIKSLYRNKEYLLLLEHYQEKLLNLSSKIDIATKLKFIDILKDRLENKKTNDFYSVISVKILNFKKISNIIGKSEFEIFLYEFVEQIKQHLSPYLLVSEYHQDFFVVLFKNFKFEELEKKAQKFYDEMEAFVMQYNFKVDFALHIVELKDLDLGVTLSLLDEIRHNSLSKVNILHKKIRYIGHYNENMSDKEIIEQLLDNSYINNFELQLFNIYKGVVIQSQSHIIKKETKSIYVTITPLQAKAMHLENIAILRSFLYPKNIKAKIAFIDMKNKIAKLENFKILEDDTFYLQKDRVEFAKKTVAILSFIGTKVAAEIKFISSTTIELEVNKTKLLSNILNKKITISFSLPKNTFEEEKIEEEVFVLDIKEKVNNQKATMYIICSFDETSKNKNKIAHFVSFRKKEILEELKNLH